MTDAGEMVKQIEDHLVPRLNLDVAEARLYYHLLRHSRLIGKHELLTSVQQICGAINCTKNTIKPRLKSLAEKGVVELVTTGWAGTRLRVLLPEEIPGALPAEGESPSLDLGTLDFYSDPRYRPAIFERERGKCFYCRRTLTDEDQGLDHVQPQVADGGNGYRNVVAACHACNSSKGSRTGADHVQSLYRRGFLTADELEHTMARIAELKAGRLRPIVGTIESAQQDESTVPLEGPPSAPPTSVR